MAMVPTYVRSYVAYMHAAYYCLKSTDAITRD